MTKLLDALQEGFQVVSPDWRYVYVNDTVCRQGRKTRDELRGRTMMECFPGIDQAPFFAVLRQCMADRSSREMLNEFIHADGDRDWFELRFQPCPEGVAILSLNVTDRKRLEATLQQAQKMDAVGQLASGVAHDFNNLLTVIASYASFAHESLPEGSRHRNDLQEILGAVDRAAKLTRQLLAFARPQQVEVRSASMNDVLRRLHPILERLLGAQVKVHLDLAPTLGDVTVDVNAIEQVLVNLAVNARDAMPDGGDLTFETVEQNLADTVAESRANVLVPGAYVVTFVRDTGTGMSREVRDRVFEPFFTTKTDGKGTGLGLATSYGIVRSAGGILKVASEEGHGSTFTVYLPRARSTPPLPL